MSTSPIHVHRVQADDVGRLIPLLVAYMCETYDDEWHGSVEALRRDAVGQRCTVHLAVDRDGQDIGFVGWRPSYDLHHCLSGGEVIDLYVARPARGRGIALVLIQAAAAAVATDGGHYLKGGAVQSGSGGRLYARAAICSPNGECTLSGRAFRHLAGLAPMSIRELLRSLPDRAWNFEA